MGSEIASQKRVKFWPEVADRALCGQIWEDRTGEELLELS